MWLKDWKDRFEFRMYILGKSMRVVRERVLKGLDSLLKVKVLSIDSILLHIDYNNKDEQTR